ncbi:fungal-specific transcription factor domain-containing protein [Xylariales sp. PMI_506]|nr:fungal-specific transcription factor domain-containing protein [Xylariales sp. PMI_506]
MGPKTKISRACQRCRRQKLKCDVERPCTLCLRAGVECIPALAHSSRNERSLGGRNIRRRISSSTADCVSGPDAQRDTATSPIRDEEEHRDEITSPSTCNNSASNTSFSIGSTMGLVAQAFQYHHSSNAPNNIHPSNAYLLSIPGSSRGSNVKRKPHQAPTFAERELQSILPSANVANLLIDNYFKQIHWFMLLFYQKPFRVMLKNTYDKVQSGGAIELGHLSVILAVMAVSLKYIDPDGAKQLGRVGTDPEVLMNAILAALKLGLLEILSLGSLESVQTCVLLGSYYLYHGEAQLAWPLCGCGLRTAQAINLHRKYTPTSPAEASSLQVDQIIQARKRCWWAIYEIETFCSMLYGFPLGIIDTDCDVEPLDTQDLWSICASNTAIGQSSLLYYKSAMSELSKIIKTALTDLYGQRSKATGNVQQSTLLEGPGLQAMVDKVALLDTRLDDWYSMLPSILRPWDADRFNEPLSSFEHSLEDSSNEDRNAEARVIQLQALTLHLAHHHTRIIIHRPLLSQMLVVPSPQAEAVLRDRNHVQYSVQVCRAAALQMTRPCSTQAFINASSTYAVTFIALHILTAGVTLSIISSCNPLSQDSYEVKLGIRRLIEMQAALTPKSIAAEQGLEVLRKLLSLVMAKEMNVILGIEPIAEMTSGSAVNVRSELYSRSSQNSGLSVPPQANATQIRTVSDLDATLAPESWTEPTLNYSAHGFADITLFGELFPNNLEPIGGIQRRTQDPGWIWSWDYEL